MEILLGEVVLAEQFREPEIPDIPQAIAQQGGAITEITSTGLSVTNPGDGSRVIEPPQALGTGATPTFAGAILGTLRVGGHETIKGIDFGSVAANPASIAAQTRGSVDVTITGVAVGDFVTMTPPDGLNTGLVYAGCRVTAADTVRIYLGNITGVAIDDGSLTWAYMWLDLT